uniref:Uncharacterized protein n=1 Tax=Arundo donax TaxID=35708 RepID=A0A0A8Z590_ARUDO
MQEQREKKLPGGTGRGSA